MAIPDLGRKIQKISLGDVWSFLKRPSLFFIRLKAQRGTIRQIVEKLFDTNSRPEEYRTQFLANHKFFENLNEKFVRFRGRRTNCEGWPELLYVLIRVVKPEIVVETGIFDGISSAVILQGLHDNNKGKLISIDLPATTEIEFSTYRMKETILPQGTQPGWAIPDYLRDRFTLLLGDSKDLLPKVLKENSSIDIFLHDSLHTFEHQWFEYNRAWPHIKNGGLLLSDDVFWNRAYHKFAQQVLKEYFVYYGFGILRK